MEGEPATRSAASARGGVRAGRAARSLEEHGGRASAAERGKRAGRRARCVRERGCALVARGAWQNSRSWIRFGWSPRPSRLVSQGGPVPNPTHAAADSRPSPRPRGSLTLARARAVSGKLPTPARAPTPGPGRDRARVRAHEAGRAPALLRLSERVRIRLRPPRHGEEQGQRADRDLRGLARTPADSRGLRSRAARVDQGARDRQGRAA